MGAVRKVVTLIVLISLGGIVPALAQPECPHPTLTKTEILLKAFQALKERGIGLVSYESLHIRVERESCGYKVTIRDDPPKPSGALWVELSPTGAVRRVNLD